MDVFTATAEIRWGFGLDGSGRKPRHSAIAKVRYGFGTESVGPRRVVRHTAAARVRYSFGCEASVTPPTSPDTLLARNILIDVLALWGGSCDTTDECIQRDAVAVVNGALQFIHANGRELPYLTKRTRIYYRAIGQRYVELESDVQHVEGDVREVKLTLQHWAEDLGSLLLGPSFPFSDLADVRFMFELGGEYETIVFTYGTDYTSAETLRAAIQARIANEAKCYIEHREGQFLAIAFDILPKFLVPFPIAGTFADTPLVNPLFLLYHNGIVTKLSYEAAPVDSPLPMIPAHSRAEVENSAAIYGAAPATRIYYVERRHEVGSDSASVRVYLGNSAYQSFVSVDVAIQPARISWADFYRGTVVPIPHTYVESLLLPIARYRATSSRRYRQRDRHEAVIQQYKEALDMLGIVDPQTTPVKDGKEADAP